MAKLYGTADPTLVAAALSHGQSMVPGDTKAIEEWKVENFELFTTGVSEAFSKIYADNKETMDLLNDNATKALEIMEVGGMPNDWGIEMHNDVVNTYKERLKDIPKGKEGDIERSKLRLEMNRYLSNIQGSEDIFQNIVSNAANSRLLNDLGDDKAKLFNLILEDHNNGTSITKPSYENGEIVYSVPGSDIKLSMKEIQKGMSTHDPKYLAGIQAKLTSFQAKGKSMGGNMSADDAIRFKNELQTAITSWDEIRNVSQEKFGNMKFTFEEVLTGQAKDPITGAINIDLLSTVYDELDALGGIDIDDDGDIDETDKSLLAQARENGEIYTDTNSGFTLIDALTKDKQKYRDVMANYLTETAVKDFYGQGATEFKGKTTTTTKNPFTAGVSFKLWDEDEEKYITKTKSKDELFTQRNQVLSGSPFEGVYGDYYVEDNTYKLNGEPISQYDILAQEKLIQSGDDASKLGGSNLGKAGGKAGGGGGGKDLSPFFGQNANEENAVEKLKIMYPHLEISAPVNPYEKIYVNGEPFFLRGKGDSTPEMEMKKLQEHITSIDPLNPNN